MLTRDHFTAGHIRALQQKSKCDPSILERTIYAFGLLEALTCVEMPFIFKGGSSLMLLLEHPRRFKTFSRQMNISVGNTKDRNFCR